MTNKNYSREHTQSIGHAKILESVIQQKRQIEKLETKRNMLHPLAIGLERSSQYVVSHKRMSIG